MKPRWPLKVVLLAAAALVVVAGAGFAWLKLAPRRVPAGQPPLVTLGPGSLPAFRDAFNGSGEEIRVLALLSPT